MANNQDNIVNPTQVQKFLSGIDYPCSKDQLIQSAKQHGADERVIQTLQQIPMGNFNSPNDVSEGIGKLNNQ